MYITGLDLGSANIKAVVAETSKEGDKFFLVGALKQPSAGFRKGILVDFNEASNSLRRIFLDIEKISKKAVKNIYINVNGAHIRSFPSRGVAAVTRADSEIQEDDIERVAQAAAAVHLPPNYISLHNITREFIVDEVGGIQDPLGMTGTRLELDSLIVGGFSPFVHTLTRCIESSGGAVGGLIFSPIASSRVVLSKQQKELGVMLIDLGASTTNFAVYGENKIIGTGSLPFGSGNVTNDIAIGLKIAIQNAETMKLNYGYALAGGVPKRETVDGEVSKKFLAEIVEVRLVEIFELVESELKKLGAKVELPAGVVAVGGGAKLPGLTDLIKQEFKLPAQIGLPDLSGFEIRNAAYADLVNDPEFAAALGLVSWSLYGNASGQSTSKSGFLSKLGLLKRVIGHIMP